ncbi:MAG: hypothetical protein QOH76_2277 [Thermoleophilaceae bacterium]|jgi:hypothetical protein|nr:hypothetical protein [Thermoleophilaceae bacterium]
MTDHPASRPAAASGVVFVLLLFGALFAPGPPPRASDSAASIAQALSEDRGVILGGMWVAGLALVFAIWFFSAVGSWLSQAAGGADRSLASAATAGGVAAVLLVLVGMLFFYGAAYQVADAKELALVRGLTDAGNAAIEMSKFGVTLFIAATSLLALRLSLMPRALALLGPPSAAVSLVSSVPLFAEGSFTEFGGGLDLAGAAPAILWILCLSIWMTIRAGPVGS